LWTERQKGRWTDRWVYTNREIDGHREIQTDKCMYRKADGRTDRWDTQREIDRQREIQTDGLMDKWTDEWAVGQIDGQMNV
jgi:hypothetical protein